MRSCMLASTLVALITAGSASTADQPSPQREAFREIYRALVELDTADASGDTLKAAETMAARLKAAGFPAGDIRARSFSIGW
jgi:hypothetical protein